ncbi:CIR protein PIR protein [Plasmodium vinckei brucechwatti]|uniref:CIR protein PIR protein n=1 Tax=Plasmodium vinckei brucechwatti TaxID=119398 RepID=A0A6V7SLT4_PLAVN|nr:CIR protein PIR protein [Plasmodium vinckei brucechwatti]
MKKINNVKGPYMRSYPYDKSLKKNQCKTDLEGIVVLLSHLINELYKQSKNKQKCENNDTQYVEYVMMWLGYRLFQTESYGSPTLSDFYNNYLMKSDGFNNYNQLILKKKYLKDANLYYMSRYYQLFQQISYITMKYPKNNPNVQGIKNDSATFYNMYTSLYNDVNEYLPSIKKSKKIVTVGFNCEKCKKVNSSAKEKKPKSAPKNSQPVKPETSTPSPSEPVPPLHTQKVSAPAPTSPEKPESVKTKTETSLSSESSQKAEQHPPSTPHAEKQSPLSPSSEQKQILPQAEPPSDPQRAASPEPQPPVLTTTIQKESPDSQGILNVPESQLSNQENSPKSSDSGQDNSANQTKEQGKYLVDKPKQSPDGQQQNPGSKHETSSGVPENANNDLGSQGVGKGGSDTEPQNPTTQQKDKNITQDNSLKQQEDLGNMILQNILSSVKNIFEKYRSPVYKTLTNVGSILYEKASSTLENVYDKSINFASNTISYLNEDLNKALENAPPSKDNGSESPPSLPEDKKQEQNIQTPIPVGQSNDTPQVSLPTHNIDSPNSKQVNPSDSPPGKQPQPSVDPSSKTPSLNIEKGNTGISAEEKTPQLVSFIDISKGYNRPEIVVTVLLIPIILGIMYKYLSSGWRKEMKRKKNMKKVINSIGGKRTVQIIINSSSQKKKTKKPINSVNEKVPLLNIYKLMQTDPVPFINLFFLLIFFVYKRKHNSLELSI